MSSGIVVVFAVTILTTAGFVVNKAIEHDIERMGVFKATYDKCIEKEEGEKTCNALVQKENDGTYWDITRYNESLEKYHEASKDWAWKWIMPKIPKDAKPIQKQ